MRRPTLFSLSSNFDFSTWTVLVCSSLSELSRRALIVPSVCSQWERSYFRSAFLLRHHLQRLFRRIQVFGRDAEKVYRALGQTFDFPSRRRRIWTASPSSSLILFSNSSVLNFGSVTRQLLNDQLGDWLVKVGIPEQLFHFELSRKLTRLACQASQLSLLNRLICQRSFLRKLGIPPKQLSVKVHRDPFRWQPFTVPP